MKVEMQHKDKRKERKKAKLQRVNELALPESQETKKRKEKKRKV